MQQIILYHINENGFRIVFDDIALPQIIQKWGLI